MELAFYPLPGLKSAYWQTILGSKLKFHRAPPSSTHYVTLADHDKLALEISTPLIWQPTKPTILMLHGLEGCHRAGYMVRLAHKLFKQGNRVIRVNLRGRGSGFGYAKQLYHGGRSEDILSVLQEQKALYPNSPTTLIGFSLGGNIALKLAGELGEQGPYYLQQVISVCAPVDLGHCAEMISRPKNHTFRRHFMRKLKKTVKQRHRLFPDLPPPPNIHFFDMHLHQFDDIYTAPYSGFKSARDYYEQAGALRVMDRIQIPCRMLFALDDPFIDSSALHHRAFPAHVELYLTKHGGHMGFLGSPTKPGGFRWMDHTLLNWILHPLTLPSGPVSSESALQTQQTHPDLQTLKIDL
jgi:predicted alpha/beta-fold hydrolase